MWARPAWTLLAFGLLAAAFAGTVRASEGRPYRVRGSVLDGRKEPVANATVVLVDNQTDPPVLWDRPEAHPLATATRTDPRGKFSFPRMKPGSYWLYARSVRGEAHLRRIGFYDEAPEHYRLHLTRTRIEGVLLWPGGQRPVADGVVRVYRMGEDGRTGGEFTTKTGSQGRFSYFGLGGGKFSLWAKAPVNVPADTKEAVVKFVSMTDPFDDATPIMEKMQEVSVRMEFRAEEGATTQVRATIPDGSVTGTVLTSDKKPVEGILAITGDGCAMTDAAGQFVVPYLPAGTHRIQVQGKRGELRNRWATVPHDRPTDLGDITLYPFSPNLILHFQAVDGRPLPGVDFKLLREGDDGYGAWGNQTDDKGRYMDNLLDAMKVRYFFVVPGHGYWPYTTVDVKEGVREFHQIVRLKTGGRIRGTVREEGSHRPAGGVAVIPRQPGGDRGYRAHWNDLFSDRYGVHLGDGAIAQVSRDGDGTFLLRDLPPGEYEVRADGQKKPCSLNDQQEIDGFDLVVPRKPSSRSISGRIFLPGGKTPLADTEATLTVSCVEPESDRLTTWSRCPRVPRRVMTDGEGRFCIYPLKPDNYWITAEAPGHRVSLRKTVRVKRFSARGIEFVLQ